jgi:hypothetical protein
MPRFVAVTPGSIGGDDGYLQAVFDWNNPFQQRENGRWYGPTIVLSTGNAGTTSTSRWPLYNWNLSNAGLL